MSDNVKLVDRSVIAEMIGKQQGIARSKGFMADTALHIAASRGYVKIVKLLAQVSDINSKDKVVIG